MEDLEENIRLFKILAADVTAFINRPPIKLLYEKSFLKLLMGKKEYAGKKIEGGKISITISGSNAKKKSACKLLSETTMELLRMRVEKNSTVDECGTYLHNQLQIAHSVNDTWDTEVLEKLKIRISLEKEKYAQENIATELAKLATERNPVASEVGDIFYYVPVVNPKAKAKRNRVEEVDYLKKHCEPNKRRAIDETPLTARERDFLKRVDEKITIPESVLEARTLLEDLKKKDNLMYPKYVIDTNEIITSQFHTPILKFFPDENHFEKIRAVFTQDSIVSRKKLMEEYGNLQGINKAVEIRNTMKDAQNGTKKNIYSYFVQKNITK